MTTYPIGHYLLCAVLGPLLGYVYSIIAQRNLRNRCDKLEKDVRDLREKLSKFDSKGFEKEAAGRFLTDVLVGMGTSADKASVLEKAGLLSLPKAENQ